MPPRWPCPARPAATRTRRARSSAPSARPRWPRRPGPRSDAPVTGGETGAERRLVSILFADLVGFTPFAAERDAEDVRETLSRYFDLASDVIGQYGGTVEKFIGDAVMAVWGAPVAREDDAERAVRAALDLVDAVRTLGPTIQARAGVLTGEAAVTVGATNQGMVAGDLVNTASRLQSVAAPGTVLVGEATERAASGAIVFEEAGEQVLKGKAGPVPPGAHSALSRSAVGGTGVTPSRRRSSAGTRSSASSRTCSRRPAGSAGRASSASSGRVGSGRPDSRGSSSSTSTASSTASGGTRDAARPTATASRSGRSAR